MGSPSTPRFFFFFFFFYFIISPPLVKNSAHFNIPGWDSRSGGGGRRGETGWRRVGNGLALHSNERTSKVRGKNRFPNVHPGVDVGEKSRGNCGWAVSSGPRYSRSLAGMGMALGKPGPLPCNEGRAWGRLRDSLPLRH